MTTSPPPSKPRRVVGLVASGVLAAIGLVIVIGSWAAFSRDARIERSGARTSGTVERVSPSLEDGGDGEYTVAYAFTDLEGIHRHATRAVSEGVWRSATEGDEIGIAFDPDRPADNFPAGHPQTSIAAAAFVSALGLVVVTIGVTLARFIRRA